jgi:hypothetical protein
MPRCRTTRAARRSLRQDRETLWRFGDAVHADRFTDVSPAAPTTGCGVIVRWLGAQGTAAVDGGHDHRPVGRLVASAQEIRSAGPVALTGLRCPLWQAQRNPESVDRGVEGVAKYMGHRDGSLREGAYAQRGTTTRERSVAMGGAQVNRRVRTVTIVGTCRTVVGTHRSPPRRRAPRCGRIVVRSLECRRRTGGLRHPLVRASALHGVPSLVRREATWGHPLGRGDLS